MQQQPAPQPPAPQPPAAAPQPPAARPSTQTQLGVSDGRLGLKRSRHDNEQQQQQPAKKKKGWPHDAAVEVQREDGTPAYKCIHGCNDLISLNITRLKDHLLQCQLFLTKGKGEELAHRDPQLRAAVDR